WRLAETAKRAKNQATEVELFASAKPGVPTPADVDRHDLRRRRHFPCLRQIGWERRTGRARRRRMDETFPIRHRDLDERFHVCCREYDESRRTAHRHRDETHLPSSRR